MLDDEDPGFSDEKPVTFTLLLVRKKENYTASKIVLIERIKVWGNEDGIAFQEDLVYYSRLLGCLIDNRADQPCRSRLMSLTPDRP